jgi:hypothetical protein
MSDLSVLHLRSAGTERALATFGEWLRATAAGFLARWRDRLARRREAPAFDAIAGMNDYMLKDIGAPSWMISRAALRNESLRRQLTGIGGPA